MPRLKKQKLYAGKQRELLLNANALRGSISFACFPSKTVWWICAKTRNKSLLFPPCTIQSCLWSHMCSTGHRQKQNSDSFKIILNAVWNESNLRTFTKSHFQLPLSYPEPLCYALEFKSLFPSGFTFWSRQAQGFGPVTWIWLGHSLGGPAPAPSLWGLASQPPGKPWLALQPSGHPDPLPRRSWAVLACHSAPAA